MMLKILSLPQEAKMKIVGLLFSRWEACNKAKVGEQLWSTTEIVHRAMSTSLFLLYAVVRERCKTGDGEGTLVSAKLRICEN
jgi:hypothetical protein